MESQERSGAKIGMVSPELLPGDLGERLPLCPGFFDFVHTVRRRGKALLESFVGLLVAPGIPDEPTRIVLKWGSGSILIWLAINPTASVAHA